MAKYVFDGAVERILKSLKFQFFDKITEYLNCIG